jgi:hypothetical protein
MTMGNTAHAQVTIVGTRPLLFHHFGPETIPADGRRERAGVAGNNPDEWRKAAHPGLPHSAGSHAAGGAAANRSECAGLPGHPERAQSGDQGAQCALSGGGRAGVDVPLWDDLGSDDGEHR